MIHHPKLLLLALLVVAVVDLALRLNILMRQLILHSVILIDSSKSRRICCLIPLRAGVNTSIIVSVTPNIEINSGVAVTVGAGKTMIIDVLQIGDL